MFSQKWDIPHPYRVSLYDSFYSKLNEGSLMGGKEGQYSSPPPFFNLKKISQEMTYNQREEGTGPQVLRPRRLCSTCSRSWERHRELGTVLGPEMVQLSQEECSLLPAISDKGRTKRGKTARFSPGSLEGDKGTFVLEPSFQMIWDLRSPWPGHQRPWGPQRTGPGRLWLGAQQHFHELGQKQQQRPS